MVVDLSPADVDRVFHALADPTRRDIVRQVLVADQSVSALARRYPISLPAVQKHVAVLEVAGLVHKQRTGREQRVSAVPARLRMAADLLHDLEATWRDRVTRMDDLL
jgi:DNA-binding transcriptional ArsR family regulator